MHFLTRIWVVAIELTDFFSFSPFSRDVNQIPLGGKHIVSAPELDIVARPKSPIFTPPGSNIEGFKCNYTNMLPDWSPCNHEDRTCWLQHKNGTKLNITTNYESLALTPNGTTRVYNLTVRDDSINPNGIRFEYAKVFNDSFPGPLIEACWGDQVIINVTNQLQFNGTSIHWHGIRQWNTMHMDGVNGQLQQSISCIVPSTKCLFLSHTGVTQCPIAPGDSIEYSWRAMQYGSSWYHSHFSVQYADGLQGPITIHGPTSAQYNTSIAPLIVGDWMNNSAFEVILPNINAQNPDILLNGTGNINRFTGTTSTNTSAIPKGYEMYFEPTEIHTRYLVRLINTAFSTAFVFSIDNHTLEIVEADFVPVKATTVDSLIIDIGQRYHFIVETLDPSSIGDGNFWIRTYPVPGCDSFIGNGPEAMNTGILRYNRSSITDPKAPNSSPWNVTSLLNSGCADSSMNDILVPMVNWTVGHAANGPSGQQFDVVLSKDAVQQFATAIFALQPHNDLATDPFQTDYGNPTFTNMGTNLADSWPRGWVVVPENYTDQSWVYLNITSQLATHPIHLHGHDFAILLQNDTAWPPPANTPLKTNNPPRRDVVVVRGGGGAIIAFKTDNPGVWLMHCHIATHASGGLGLQILERQADANGIWPPGHSNALLEAQRVCGNWNSWAYDCRNYWPGNLGTKKSPFYPTCGNMTELQNDAGI